MAVKRGLEFDLTFDLDFGKGIMFKNPTPEDKSTPLPTEPFEFSFFIDGRPLSEFENAEITLKLIDEDNGVVMKEIEGTNQERNKIMMSLKDWGLREVYNWSFEAEVDYGEE